MSGYSGLAGRHASPNFGLPRGEHGRSGHRPRCVVVHITDGGAGPTHHWFMDPNGASSNYLVHRNGKAYQYVEDEDAPWTNGIDFSRGYEAYKSDLSLPLVKECWDRGINPNEVCLTIEAEGTPATGLTAAQEQVIAEIAKERSAALGFALTPQTFFGHNRWDAVNRPYCPGPKVRWATLFQLAGVAGAAPPKPTLNDVIAEIAGREWARYEAAKKELPILRAHADADAVWYREGIEGVVKAGQALTRQTKRARGLE